MLVNIVNVVPTQLRNFSIGRKKLECRYMLLITGCWQNFILHSNFVGTE